MGKLFSPRIWTNQKNDLKYFFKSWKSADPRKSGMPVLKAVSEIIRLTHNKTWARRG